MHLRRYKFSLIAIFAICCSVYKWTYNMGDIEGAKRAKTASAGWLTRACTRMDELLGTDLRLVARLEYEDVINNYDIRLAKWDDAEALVEGLIPETELEATLDSACVFREKCSRTKLAFLVDWDRSHPPPAAPAGSSMSNVSDTGTRQKSVRLPKIELPKFSGEVLKFMPFWQQFEACVDEQDDIPDVTKFNYLIGALKGEAKNIVEGLPITGENYREAKHIVIARYGRPELIVFSHVQALLSTSTPNGTNVTELMMFRDKLVAHIRSLAAMGIESEKFGVILTPIIVSRLPEEIRLEWSRDSEKKEADLDFLMEFLEKECKRRERCKSFGALTGGQKDKRERQRTHGSASALQTVSATDGGDKCGFCSKGHVSQNCYKYLKSPTPERQTKVNDARLCFKCLGRNHIAKNCNKVCEHCKRGHHGTLCFGIKRKGPLDAENAEIHKIDKSSTDDVTVRDSSTETDDAALFVSKSSVSVLPMATVKVRGTDKCCTATLLFDSGSDRSYVSNALVKRLKPKFIGKTQANFSSFGGQTHKTKSNIVELNVMGQSNERDDVCVKLVEVPVICAPLIRPKVTESLLDMFQDLDLAHNYRSRGQITIDILIGQDLLWNLMEGKTFRPDVGCWVVAQKSIFG